MNSKVLVTIKGIQHDYNEDADGIQTIQQGTYKRISNKHIITYEELPEDMDSSNPVPVKNMLKICSDSVSLTKRGQTSTDMFFKEGYHHTGLYEIPCGTLQMGIITSELTIKEDCDTITVNIKYGLELNHSHMSDCSILITIKSI